VRIREARPEDASALAGLVDALGYPGSAVALRTRLGAFEADAGSFVLIAVGAGRVLGLASATVLPLLHEEGGWCRLSALVVDSNRRRAGIGRKLVEEVEERARAAGCRYLEVTSGERPERDAAHAFYEALGLERVSRRYLKEL
jgi:GNAT superfamily N-acetyltransferase